MKHQTTPEAAARRLREAYTNGPVPPLRDTLAPTDADTAYRIQSINTAHWLDQGRRISGWKIGLTARAVQRQLGVDQPDFGVLFHDMAVPDGGSFPVADAIAPRGEAEIALVLGQDLDHTHTTPETIAPAIAHAVPAIEIVDSRITDWRITFADTVADNGSSARYVLGAARRPLAGLDLYSCGMVLEVDGDIASVGAGAACLGHPLNAAAWLARTLHDRGEPLRAGQIILTGALGPMVALVPGRHIKAVIGGLGSVSFTCGASS